MTEEALLDRIRADDPSLTKLHLVFEPSSYFDPDSVHGFDAFLELLRGSTSITYILLERRLARGLSEADNNKLLRTIFEMPHLQEVEIWSQRVSWSVLISAAMSAKELRKLGLGMVTLKDVTCSAASHPTLETFYLSDFRLLPSSSSSSDENDVHLDPVLSLLGRCPNLSRVEIYSFQEERPAVATTLWPLFAAPRLSQVTLRRLHLPASIVDQDEYPVAVSSPLRVLDVSENSLGDDGVTRILRKICGVDSIWRTSEFRRKVCSRLAPVVR